MSNAFESASLVMLPNIYEEGTLYSAKPTDRSGDFTFSRGADTATRVGEDGYIKKEHSNLLSQSNNFDTSPWLLSSTLTATPGELGYDGSNDAWKITKNSGGEFFSQSNSFSNELLTFSIYAKAGDSDWVRFFFIGNNAEVFFDLSTPTGGIGFNRLLVDVSITPVGSGWFRISLTSSTSNSAWRIYPAEADGVVSGTTGSIYVQDAQINQGLVATPYLETTTAPVYGGLTDNMPRLDYTDATCPSLLLEPERSNVATDSEYIDIWIGTGFNKNFGFTSPEGVNNAYEIRIDSAGGAPSNLGPQLQTSISASTQYTVSVFVKPLDTLSGVRILTFNDDAQRGGDFDFTNNTFTAFNTGQETGEVIPFGDNGWYRVSFTYTSGLDVSVAYRVCFPLGTVRDGNTAFLLYGLQVEEGSYPTSYIPTYGSAQTRAGENLAVQLSVLDFFSLGNTESGTFFLETKFTKPSSQNFVDVFSAATGASNSWALTNFQIRDTSTTNGFLVQNINDLVDDYIKIAIRKDNTTFNLFINGAKSVTTATITNPLKATEYISANRNNQSIKQMMEFPTALSDDECIALTTL